MVQTKAATTPTDVRIRIGGDQFKFRVSALVFREGELLATTFVGADYCYLLGGKVQIGESAETAMRRELVEETGHDLPVGELLLVTESLYDHAQDAALRHELTFYFRIDVPPALSSAELTAHPEDGHDFSWIPLDRLAEAAFRPTELIGLLPELAGSRGGPLRHLTFDRRVAAR